jgi:hypothetical protein
MELQVLFHHHWDSSDEEIDLGPFDEHPFHSSGDEAECSKRALKNKKDDELDGAVLPEPEPEPDLMAAVNEGEEPAAVAAAAPIVEPAVAMEMDD